MFHRNVYSREMCPPFDAIHALTMLNTHSCEGVLDPLLSSTEKRDLMSSSASPVWSCCSTPRWQTSAQSWRCILWRTERELDPTFCVVRWWTIRSCSTSVTLPRSRWWIRPGKSAERRARSSAAQQGSLYARCSECREASCRWKMPAAFQRWN